MNCTVFASGGGSNFQALLDRHASGELHVNFGLCISNNRTAAALDRARNNGIPAVHLAPSHFADDESYAARLLSLLEEHRTELIILAGYMKKLPAAIIATYRDRIVNIHPGLLPAFGGKGMYGSRVHQAVLDYGAKITGVTIHFVDEEYDHGPILHQEAVPVRSGDTAETLARRVLEIEHASYWRAIEAIAQGRIRVQGNRVVGDV